MKNRKLVLAFILSTMLSLIVGFLSDLTASYLAPSLANQSWLVYGTLIFTFTISLPISIYLFLRGSTEESATQPISSSVDVPLDSKPKVVSNLPARGEFIGREKEKKRVLEGLKSNYPFVVIQGPAGIGKTALARETGWILKEESAIQNGDNPHFEAIVWAEDHDGELTINELLDTIGNILDCHRIVKLPLANKLLEIAKQLQERKCLIIIDNFETISDQEIKDFVIRIPSPMSRAIVTSRKKVLQDNGWIVPLDKMNPEDQFALARNEAKRLVIGLPDGQDTETVLRKVCKFTEGDPYSIRMKVALIQTGTSLQAILHAAYDDEERLQPIWDALQEAPAAIKAIVTISLFQSPPVFADIEFVSELTETELSRGLKYLDKLFLVDIHDETEVHLYSLHSRTKAFVTKKLLADQTLSHVIHRRMADWIEMYVLKHGGLKNWSGYSMLDQQYATIMNTVDWCSQQASEYEKNRVITIWRAIDHYMSVKGNMKDYIKLGSSVLECAKSLGDLNTKVDVEVEVLGFAYMTEGCRGQLDGKEDVLKKAETLILQGLRAYQDSGNLAGISTANRYLGIIAQRRGNHKSAQEYFEKSLEHFELIPGWSNLGAVLSSLGILAREQNDIRSAVEYQSRRLALAKALKNPEGIAVASYNLGRIAQISGKDAQAIDFYRQALKAAYRASKNDVIAASQRRLVAYILKQGGDIAEATQMAENAHEYYNIMGEIPDEMTVLITRLRTVSRLQSRPLRRLILRIRQMNFFKK